MHGLMLPTGPAHFAHVRPGASRHLWAVPSSCVLCSSALHQPKTGFSSPSLGRQSQWGAPSRKNCTQSPRGLTAAIAQALSTSTSEAAVAAASSNGSQQSSNGAALQRSQGTSPYVLVAGAYVLPHPDKMARGGEDWFFVSDTMHSLGVADGVGGWAEIGVDAGAYARQLMGFAKELADQLTAPGCAEYDKLCSNMTKPPQDAAEVKNSTANMLQQTILERAHSQVDVRGSSTASLLVLAGDRVLASNLGDSGFLVLRNGQVIFHSPQQQHDFNFPFQIGSSDSMSDMPASAQKFELAVQAGDVVVMGTDGLWDNCFDEEIMSVIRYCQDVNMPLDKTAQVLAHYARHRASDPKFASPFAYAAFQAGFAYMGGKMDDITVVVARVAHALEVADNPLPGQGGQDLTMPHLASKL
ncbi:Serine/threonine phosphatase, family 2C [Haematococcus lacustris]